MCPLQAHHGYENYREKSVIDFQKFSTIYGDSIADGRDAMLISQPPPHPMDAPKTQNNTAAAESSSLEKRDGSAIKIQRTINCPSMSSRRNARQESTTDEVLAVAIKEFTATMSQVAKMMIQIGPCQNDVVLFES